MEVNPRNNNNEVVLIDIFDIKPSNPPSIDLDNVFRQFDIKINEPTITVKDDDLIMKDYENIFIKKTKKNDKKLNDNKPITNNKTEESNVGNPSKPSNKPTTNNKTEESNVGNPTKSSNKPISDNKQPLNLLDMMKPTNNKQPLNLLDIMKPTNNTLNNNQSLNLLDSMKPTNNTLNNKQSLNLLDSMKPIGNERQQLNNNNDSNNNNNNNNNNHNNNNDNHNNNTNHNNGKKNSKYDNINNGNNNNQKNIVRVDIIIVPYESLPTALLHFTGSADFNQKIRLYAKKLCYMLNEYGLFKGTKRIMVNSEKDVFDKLMLKYVPPNER